MDVEVVLKDAWAAVGSAGLPEKLHEVAFREAVRLITGQAGPAPAPAPASVPGGGADRRSKKIAAGGKEATASARASTSAAAEARPTVTEDEFLRKVSNETGVDVDTLETLFHLHDGKPQISRAARTLGDTNGTQMRTVAQLLSVAYATGLHEPEISIGVVRKECERLRCADSNFSRHVAALDGVVYVGSERARRLKVRSAGVAAFARIVNELTTSASSAAS